MRSVEENSESDQEVAAHNPGMKERDQILQKEIKRGKRVRIYQEERGKLADDDKEAYLNKNIIVGTAKLKKKQEQKQHLNKMMRRLSTQFELDSVLEEDSELKKRLMKQIHEIQRKEIKNKEKEARRSSQ